MNIDVELSEEASRIIKAVAERTGRSPSDIVREWIDRSVVDLPVDVLPDDEVLALCDLMLNDQDQSILSDLLSDQREGVITEAGRRQLDDLLQIYRRGMVRKSEALRVAVQRGLRPPLG